MFHLAIKAGVPIVPVCIIGAGAIMSRRSLRINPGKVTMIIDKPIDVTVYTIEDRVQLIERVRNVIVSNYTREISSTAVEPSSAAEIPASPRQASPAPSRQ
jgi:1-acyl-sn-glycerol-3-phosphate acyltransferase